MVFTVHKLYVEDADGKYIAIGFGVLNPDGQLAASATTVDDANSIMKGLASGLTRNR